MRRDSDARRMMDHGLHGMGAGRPPMPPGRPHPDPNYSAPHQGYSGGGGSLSSAHLPPRMPPAANAVNNLQVPDSGRSRQHVRSSFGQMFELSNQIDRLGSGH